MTLARTDRGRADRRCRYEMKNGTATAPETLSFQRGPRLPGLGENFKNFDTSYLRGGTEGLQIDGAADCKEGRPA